MHTKGQHESGEVELYLPVEVAVGVIQWLAKSWWHRMVSLGPETRPPVSFLTDCVTVGTTHGQHLGPAFQEGLARLSSPQRTRHVWEGLVTASTVCFRAV